MSEKKHKNHKNHNHDCTPRSTPLTIRAFPANHNFVIPNSPSPIDEILTSLMEEETRDDEVLQNGLKLISSAEVANNYMARSGHEILDRVRDNFIASVSKDDEKEKQKLAKDVAHYIVSELRLLFTLGFLSGTAIGFLAGREFEREFVEDDGDEDDDDNYPPDYESPMI